MPPPGNRRDPIGRLGRLVVVALVVGVGISQLILTPGDWHLRDSNAYWDAATRLRDGGMLFPELADTEGSDVYRYAPWFAWAWIPLTYLPRDLVNVLWSIALVGASAASLVPLARRRAWLACALFLPILIGISAIGNVQPLLIAALVLGVERRSGPLWIAMAASLKVVPILLIVTYIGRGEWRRAGMTVALLALLALPVLMYDLSHYPTNSGEAAMLLRWPVFYVVVVVVALGVAFRLAASRYAWLASSTAVALATPRFFVYDLTYLMVSLPFVPRREAAVPARGEKNRS